MNSSSHSSSRKRRTLNEQKVARKRRTLNEQGAVELNDLVVELILLIIKNFQLHELEPLFKINKNFRNILQTHFTRLPAVQNVTIDETAGIIETGNVFTLYNLMGEGVQLKLSALLNAMKSGHVGLFVMLTEWRYVDGTCVTFNENDTFLAFWRIISPSSLAPEFVDLLLTWNEKNGNYLTQEAIDVLLTKCKKRSYFDRAMRFIQSLL